jgi:hypothetical protein
VLCSPKLELEDNYECKFEKDEERSNPNVFEGPIAAFSWNASAKS